MLKAGGPVFPTKRVLWFLGTVLLFGVAMNFTMFIDGIILKPIVTHKFAAAGLPHPADLGNTMVAFYSAVQNLVRLPYQAILAVTFVIFPLVSRSTFEKDTEATKGYIQQTLRYPLIFRRRHGGRPGRQGHRAARRGLPAGASDGARP